MKDAYTAGYAAGFKQGGPAPTGGVKEYRQGWKAGASAKAANARRIERARVLEEAYLSLPDTDGDSPHDMISDILHMIHAEGGDTEAAVRMAVSNFEAERDGEE